MFGRRAVHQRFPYAHDDERDAPVILKNAREAREIADAEGVQVHTHVFRGDLEFAERSYGRATVLGILGPDVVLDHVNNLSAAEVALIAASQANVVAVTFVGETVGYGACPVVELLGAGANVAITTDGSAPYSSLDLWREPSRTMFTHRIRPGDMAVLPPGKALRMVTIDAAKALNLEHEVGSLEVGKQADVVLVDLRRPHLTPRASIPSLLAYYAAGNDVETTVTDGTVVMENRVAKTADEPEILRLAMEEQRRALTRVDISGFLNLGDDFWRGARDRSEVVG